MTIEECEYGCSGGVCSALPEEPKPDLIVSSITWSPANPVAGDTVTFTIHVENQGNASTGTYFYVDYYIKDLDVGQGYVYVGQKRVDPLAAGSESVETFLISHRFTSTYNFKVKADAWGWISEFDETNNARAVSLSGAEYPPTLVVHVHGFGGDSEDWSKWRHWDGGAVEDGNKWVDQDGIQHYAITFADSQDTVVVHGAELADKINSFIDHEFPDVDRIIMVAHSKGGVDAREYISRNGGHEKVDTLIMMGTPNAGQPLADIGALLPWYGPGVDDMTYAAMADFNRNTPNVQGVYYFAIAGTKEGPLSLLISGIDDGYVQTSSALDQNYLSSQNNPTRSTFTYARPYGPCPPPTEMVSLTSRFNLGHTELIENGTVYQLAKIYQRVADGGIIIPWYEYYRSIYIREDFYNFHHGVFAEMECYDTNTSWGTDVTVALSDPWTGQDTPITVTFADVWDGGYTSAIEIYCGELPVEPLPAVQDAPLVNFRLFPEGIYYQIETTAEYTGTIIIAMDYDDTGLTLEQEQELMLMKLVGYEWVDITTSLDTANNTIRGETTSLSLFGVMLDIAPPIVSIISPEDGALVDEIVTISVEATDNVGVTKVEFYIDGELKDADTDLPYSWDWDTTTMTDGSHTIKATAYDLASNEESDSITVIRDTTPPTVTITNPEDGAIVGEIVTIGVEATDNVGVDRVEFYIDDGEPEYTDTDSPYAWDWDVSIYAEGSHTIKVRAYDRAGNSATDQLKVIAEPILGIVDTVPPTFAITVVPDLTSAGEVTITATVSETLYEDPTITVKDSASQEITTVSLGKENNTCTYSATITDITGNGTATIEMSGLDLGGNIGIGEKSFIVDTRPPVVSIINPLEGAIVGGTTTIEASAYDTFAGVAKAEFYVDDTLESTDTTLPYTYDWDTTTRDDGTCIIKAVAHDTLGNSASDQISVTVDNTPPKVSIVRPEEWSILYQTVTIEAEAWDDSGVSRVEFFVNDALESSDTTIPYTCDWDTTTVEEGVHTIGAVAYDLAGNSAISQIDVRVVHKEPATGGVDYIPPEVTISSPQEGDVYIATLDKIIINFAVTDNMDPDPVATAYLTLIEGSGRAEDGTTYPVTNGQEIVDLLDLPDYGFYTFTAEAMDWGGNVTIETTDPFEVIWDILSPRTTISVGTPQYSTEPIYLTSATEFTFTAVDDLIEVGDEIGLGVAFTEWWIDDKPPVRLTNPDPQQSQPFNPAPFRVEGLPDGPYTIFYRSTDILGNKEDTKALSIYLDNTSPVTIFDVGEPRHLVPRPSPWGCGDPIEDADGNTYNTVLIGSQCWMAENLDYDNGCSSVTWVKYSDEGWCGYYNGTDYGEGLLYQWSAAMNGSTTEGAQGLCPSGWHIPTDAEWCTLEEALGCSNPCGSIGWRCAGVGTKLKSGGSLGFEGLQAGYRYPKGGFNYRGTFTYYWSCPQYGASSAWLRHLGSGHSAVYRNAFVKAFGFSVRCLQD